MSRFAVDPKWLIYLPPTMSPSRDKSKRPGLLEHPQEAFAYYRHEGVPHVCLRREAHGLARGGDRLPRRSRRSEALRRRSSRRSAWSIPAPVGASSTTTQLEARIAATRAQAADARGFWDEFDSDWFCLDCELMPWSAKAQDLLRCAIRGRRRCRACRRWRSKRSAAAGRRAAYRRSSTNSDRELARARRSDSAREISSTPIGTTAGR